MELRDIRNWIAAEALPHVTFRLACKVPVSDVMIEEEDMDLCDGDTSWRSCASPELDTAHVEDVDDTQLDEEDASEPDVSLGLYRTHSRRFDQVPVETKEVSEEEDPDDDWRRLGDLNEVLLDDDESHWSASTLSHQYEHVGSTADTSLSGAESEADLDESRPRTPAPWSLRADTPAPEERAVQSWQQDTMAQQSERISDYQPCKLYTEETRICINLRCSLLMHVRPDWPGHLPSPHDKRLQHLLKWIEYIRKDQVTQEYQRMLFENSRDLVLLQRYMNQLYVFKVQLYRVMEAMVSHADQRKKKYQDIRALEAMTNVKFDKCRRSPLRQCISVDDEWVDDGWEVPRSFPHADDYLLEQEIFARQESRPVRW